MLSHSRLLTLSALALGVAGALASGNAAAAGFQLKENSVKSQGTSFAGTAAKTGDSSVVVNNPAAMTQFEGTTMQADVTVIDLNYEFQGTGTDALGQPLTGSNGGNAGGVTPVPALSVVHKLDNGVAVGAMISAPFGLATEYEDGWMGRYAAHTSDVRVVDLTLSAALDITDRFSVGAGLIASRADVTLSKSVDFGTLLFSNPATRPLPFARPQQVDGFAEIEGDDVGFGYIIGMHLRPTDNVAIGVSYRSEVDYELTGTADWTVPDNVRTVFNANPMTAPLFADGTVSADLTTPSILNVGVSWKATDRLALMGTYAHTGWSSLREVRIRFDNPDPDSVEPFEWSDVSYYALGAEYLLNDAWTLRGGVAYDETPTSIEHRTPRLPDANRMFYSIGATWRLSDAFDVNFAYTRIEPDSPRIDMTEAGYRLSGPFDGDANLFGISAQYRF
ncbi:OmpP1/FadL family transporter [Luteimonas yindakuii]|nr:outer membrane protein transport protein [Luteimonas yindakuii]